MRPIGKNTVLAYLYIQLIEFFLSKPKDWLMTIDTRNIKFGLIELIMNIDDSDLLERIKEELIKIKEESQSSPNIEDAVRPIRKNVTLEQIDQEQNYTPFNYKEFRILADELELEEPIEELLEMLTK